MAKVRRKEDWASKKKTKPKVSKQNLLSALPSTILVGGLLLFDLRFGCHQVGTSASLEWSRVQQATDGAFFFKLWSVNLFPHTHTNTETCTKRQTQSLLTKLKQFSQLRAFYLGSVSEVISLAICSSVLWSLCGHVGPDTFMCVFGSDDIWRVILLFTNMNKSYRSSQFAKNRRETFACLTFFLLMHLHVLAHEQQKVTEGNNVLLLTLSPQCHSWK